MTVTPVLSMWPSYGAPPDVFGYGDLVPDPAGRSKDRRG